MTQKCKDAPTKMVRLTNNIIDIGTFSHYEHGEVNVPDVGKVDLVLRNYDRFLNISLDRDNNITSSKIYQSVINKERKGD